MSLKTFQLAAINQKSWVNWSLPLWYSLSCQHLQDAICYDNMAIFCKASNSPLL